MAEFGDVLAEYKSGDAEVIGNARKELDATDLVIVASRDWLALCDAVLQWKDSYVFPNYMRVFSEIKK